MADALYLKDTYLKEFDAKVVSVKDGKYVVLDQTAFYPTSGGQPHDTGVFIRKSDGQEFKVVYVGKFDGKISHEIEPVEGVELKQGDEVTGKIDWGRRYLLMRHHTSAHVIAAIIHKETGALITGNQLGLEKSRLDFSLEDFDRDQIMGFADKANELIAKELPVTISFIPRSEAEQMPELARLAKGLPEGIQEIRVIAIDDFDKQACGGTHLKNISEIGAIGFTKLDNKGKNNRRLYYVVKEGRAKIWRYSHFGEASVSLALKPTKEKNI